MQLKCQSKYCVYKISVNATTSVLIFEYNLSYYPYTKFKLIIESDIIVLFFTLVVLAQPPKNINQIEFELTIFKGFSTSQKEVIC